MFSFGLPSFRLPLRLTSPHPTPAANKKPAEHHGHDPQSRHGMRLVPGTNVPAPGAHLGRYELLAPLGAGGMAEVHRARTVGPGGFERSLVIKRILPGQSKDPEFVQMFIDEAKILGMLHHPNVVQAYDFGEDNGTLFLALEYVDGPSVSRVLRSLRATNRHIPAAMAAYIVREVCRALAYVHDLKDASGQPMNVVHRDVTPSNILLTAFGGVKLLDFGVAKFNRAEQATRAGTVKGKPAYLAPEQLEGKTIDGRVDLFALGIVLHEMLSLEHLFAGDSDLVTVKKIMEMEIPVPSVKRADIPPALDQIVMTALQRDRDKRYASAAEMGRALDDVVVGANLRMEDVAAFIADLEADVARQARPPRPLRLVTPPPTPDAALRMHDEPALLRRVFSLRERFQGRPRGAVLACLFLALLGVATLLGLLGATARQNVARAAAAASHMSLATVVTAPTIVDIPPICAEDDVLTMR